MKNNSIKIRRATKKDLLAIQKLNLALFKKERLEYDNDLDLHWTYNQGKPYFLKKIAGRDSFVAIARSRQRTIGYLCGALHRSPVYKFKQRAQLENMIVTDKHRHQGIGSALMVEFFKWCRDKKINNISVNAFIPNIKAKKFYKKHGFREQEIILKKKIIL